MSDCAPVAVMDDGWSEWLHPITPFRMQCCECGLVHVLEFAIAPADGNGSERNEGETDDALIIFRARREDGL